MQSETIESSESTWRTLNNGDAANGQDRTASPKKRKTFNMLCIFCDEPFTSIASLREHSATCRSHPAVVACREYREVAAVVCMDVDVLAELAHDTTLTVGELRDQIRLVHEQKEEATSKPEVRKSRYAAAASQRKTFNMPDTVKQPETAAQLEPLIGRRVWCTKYCLTGPITEHELVKTVDGMAVVKHTDGLNGAACLFANDWHYDKRDATERFDVMLAAKLVSLAKQIRKLGAMEDVGPTFKGLPE